MRPSKCFRRPVQVLAVVAAVGTLLAEPAAAQSAEAARLAARKALQTNPEVQARLKAFLAKTDAVDAASAGWLPRVDMNADGGIDRSQDAGAGGDRTVKRAGIGLAVSQVLWDGLATRNEVNRANHDRLARWFEFVDSSEQITLEAARAVYDVQRQRKLVALAEDNLAQHKAAAAKIESRVGAGVGRGVDLDQARARLALAESNLETELSNLHDVAARYQRIVGETPPADMGALELLRSNLPRSAEEAVATALAKSPVIAAGIENVRAARAAEAGRRSALQPRIEARARVNGGRNLGGIVERQSDAAVELVMNWNLYDGGANQARVREQANNVGQALDLRDKACRDVRQNVAVAFNEGQKLSGQLSTLARNSAAIERARDAYRQQFDIGQRSLLDLLNAENEAYTARRALTNAVYDRAVAYVRTLAAMSLLNVQLDIARDSMPKGSGAWSAGADAANGCPVQTIDMGALRAGMDPAVVAASVMAAALPPGQALPASAALPVSQAANPVLARPVDPAVLTAQMTPRVNAWVQALRKRDVAALAGLYTPGFKGDEPSPKHWAAKQEALLQAKTPVKVELDGLVTEARSADEVETRFRQVRTAGQTRSVQNKVLLWKQVEGEWRIAREASM